MIEVWHEIEGYEGCYYVSNTGKVKATGKKGINPYGANLFIKEVF